MHWSLWLKLKIKELYVSLMSLVIMPGDATSGLLLRASQHALEGCPLSQCTPGQGHPLLSSPNPTWALEALKLGC